MKSIMCLHLAASRSQSLMDPDAEPAATMSSLRLNLALSIDVLWPFKLYKSKKISKLGVFKRSITKCIIIIINII